MVSAESSSKTLICELSCWKTFMAKAKTRNAGLITNTVMLLACGYNHCLTTVWKVQPIHLRKLNYILCRQFEIWRDLKDVASPRGIGQHTRHLVTIILDKE